MFDPNAFDKQIKAAQVAYEAFFSKARSDFADAFADIPNQIKKAFTSSDLKEYQRIIKNVSDDFDDIKDHLKEIEKQKEFLKDQAKTLQQILNDKRDLYKKDVEIAELFVKHAATMEDLIKGDDLRKELAEQLAKEEQVILNLLKSMKNAQDGLVGREKALVLEFKKQRSEQATSLLQNKLFGKSMGELVEQGQKWRGIWKDTSIFTKVGALVGLIVKNGADAFRELRESGNSAAQSLGGTLTAFQAQWYGLLHGVIASTGAFAKGEGILQNAFGTTEISAQLVSDATKLSENYNLSADQVGNLVGMLERANGWSDRITSNQIKQLQTIGNTFKYPVGKLYQDLATSSNEFARYSDRGVAALAKGAISLSRMNTDMNRIGSIMDGFVDDFDSALQRGASLQTVIPGLNVNELIKAAQFATPDQFAATVRNVFRQAGITDVNQLQSRYGRSITNQVARGIGTSKTELEGILRPARNPIPEAQTGLLGNDTFNNFLNSIGNFIAGNKLATSALGIFATALTSFALHGAWKAVAEPIGATVTGIGAKLFGQAGGKVAEKTILKEGTKIGEKTALKSIAKKLPLVGLLLGAGFAFDRAKQGDLWGAGGELASGLAALLPGYGTLASIGIDAGLAGRDIVRSKAQSAGGKSLLNAIQSNQLSSLTSSQGDSTNTSLSGLLTDSTGDNQEVINKLSQMVKTQEQLLQLFKNGGFSVNMDGKKVGSTIVEAFSRGGAN